MPKLNGLELLQEIRLIDKDIPYIITSAFMEPEYLLESIKYNVTAYLPKPVNTKNLFYKIEHVCQEKFSSIKLIHQEKEISRYLETLNKVALVSKTDLDGVITYANKIFCEVSKYSEKELLGQPHNIIRHPDVPKSTFKDLWETIQAGNKWQGKVKNRAKDGTPYYLQATVFPLYDDTDENITGYIAIRFLTTEDENEKREFKKRVILNLQENRKKEIALNSVNSVLEEELLKVKLSYQELENHTIDITKKLRNTEKELKFRNTQIDKIPVDTESNNKRLMNQLKLKKDEIEKYIDINKKLKIQKTKFFEKTKNIQYSLAILEKENKQLKEASITKNKQIVDLKNIIENLEKEIKKEKKKSVLKKYFI